MSGGKRVAGLVRPSKGGRITIPIELRERLGIDEHTVLELSVNGDELRLKPASNGQRETGRTWLDELYDLFAPVREEAKAYNEEEINAAIDEAVKAVRRSRA